MEKEQFGTVTLIHSDCMEYMRTLPENAFDLAVVDPPYGIAGNPSRHGGGGAGKLKNRVLNQNAKRFKEWDMPPDESYFNELFRVATNQVIWGGNYFSLPRCRCFICWDKVQPWLNFSQAEYAWTSFERPAKLFRCDNRTGGKIHPTQKPVKLYGYIFCNFAKEGDRILDTHLGSGSSAIAAYDMGFEFVGIEIDKDYFESARERLKQHIKGIQPKLDMF